MEMTMLKLGWKAGPEQYQPKELLEYAIAAENAGFDSIDVSDHFHPWSESGQACFSWTWLGAAAVQTSKIVLGTGITCPILRYHPAIIAQASATLGVLAPDRAYLCVGTGEALNEYAATGEWPGYEERQAMLIEAINLIRSLWTGQETTFEGIYYHTRKAKLYTKPEKPIPLYVSTMVPESSTFAGRYGDGLITVGGGKPETYKKILENFEAGAKEAGKDPSKMPRLIELNVAYTEDKDAAIKSMKEYWAGSFLPALFNQKIYTPRLAAKNGEAVGSDTMEKMMCISSRPEDHVSYVRKYIDLGFDHFFYHYAGPNQKEFLEGYGRDVLPKIRKLSG
jgi:coenzyme F420-dependent glucose-6-phosphate dehydrogenase